MSVLLAWVAGAETLPSAVDGVITLNVPAGTTNVYSGALSSATKFVKTGRGWAVLGTATSAFTGVTEVHEGVLKITDKQALGASPSVAVTSGAVFFLNVKVSGGQGVLHFPGPVKIAGTGCDGMGPIHFVPAAGSESGCCPDNLVKTLELTDDATIYVPSRWGLYGSTGIFRLNGHTLTRAQASATPDFMVNTAVVEPGTIRLLGGTQITLQGACGWTGDDTNTTIQLDGTSYLYFWGVSTPVKAKVVVNSTGTSLKVGNGGVGRNFIAGEVVLNTNTLFTVDADRELRIDGPLNFAQGLWSQNLRKNGTGTLVLNGPVRNEGSDLPGNSRNYFHTQAGWTLLTNDSQRIFGSWNFNGTGCGLLADGYLWSGMLRIANGASSGLFRQTGGVYCNNPNDSAYIGETGNGTTTSYGAYILEGGEGHFSNNVYIAANQLSRGLVLQKGGRFIHSRAGAVQLGKFGDGWMHVSGGTNETRGSMGIGTGTFYLSPHGGAAALAVTGSNTVFHTACLTMGCATNVTTNVIAVADGAQFRLDRFISTMDQPAGSRNTVFFDGGVVYPTFYSGWNHVDPTGANFYRRSPTWYVGARGMTVDAGACMDSAEKNRGTSCWPHALTSPSGKGFASVTLPTDNSAFASAAYFQPAVLRFEGAGHGAAGYAEFDFATKKLGRVVIMSSGCGYDETSKVYVEGPDCRTVYECAYTLADCESGPVVYRGGTVEMYPTNTYTGTTVVESGTLVACNPGSIPVNGALAVKRGATVNARNKRLVVSSLQGEGTVGNASEVKVTTKLVVNAAELFANRQPLTVSSPLTLDEGVTVEVEDPDELANHTRDAAAPFLVATSTLTGSAVFVRPEGVVGVWKAYRVGSTFKFGMVHATTFVLR